uniref:Heme-binding protein 1 n=1 Tax=Sphaeramia orbicularis TaxID=375764 RepID=A0A672YI49_9TELE
MTEPCRTHEQTESNRCKYVSYASLSSEGRTFDQVTGELVRKLLMYIGGSNESSTTGHGCTTGFLVLDGVLCFKYQCTVYFLIPSSIHSETAEPVKKKKKKKKKKKVYLMQFGGFAGESEYRAEALRLTRTLGETAPFQRKQYFCCSYDPIKPYGRRNEVWFLQDEP